MIGSAVACIAYIYEAEVAAIGSLKRKKLRNWKDERGVEIFRIWPERVGIGAGDGHTRQRGAALRAAPEVWQGESARAAPPIIS